LDHAGVSLNPILSNGSMAAEKLTEYALGRSDGLHELCAPQTHNLYAWRVDVHPDGTGAVIP
jgi:hypothetical protein